jgi:hypothetical protein
MQKVLTTVNANKTDRCQVCKKLIGVGEQMALVRSDKYKDRFGGTNGIYRMHPNCV